MQLSKKWAAPCFYCKNALRSKMNARAAEGAIPQELKFTA